MRGPLRPASLSDPAPRCKLARVQVQLCKKALERLEPRSASLIEALRDREHVPAVKDCVNRCEQCERGELVAIADGTPLGAPTVDDLLASLDALAAADDV